MISIDIITSAIREPLYFDPRVLIWPDTVVSVLRALLNTCNLDRFGGFVPNSRVSVSDSAREGFLHSLLFPLLDMQKLVRHGFSVISLICSTLQPGRQVLLC
jgi:hypothetical protein